jgi:Holliday junction resolvase RusA-like endonuclease
MHRIKIKPLSVNDAWRGQRLYKTKMYSQYERDLPFLLPRLDIPKDVPLSVSFHWGFSSSASDIDNPLKPTTDIIARTYGFNDKQIHKLSVSKEKVKRGEEFFDFEIAIID